MARTKSPDVSRNKHIRVVVNEVEDAAIAERARQHGHSKSSFLRWLGLTVEVPAHFRNKSGR